MSVIVLPKVQRLCSTNFKAWSTIVFTKAQHFGGRRISHTHHCGPSSFSMVQVVVSSTTSGIESLISSIVVKEARPTSISSSQLQLGLQWQKKKMNHRNVLSCVTTTYYGTPNHQRHHLHPTFCSNCQGCGTEKVKEGEIIHDIKPIQQQQPEPDLLLCFFNVYASTDTYETDFYFLKKEHDDIENGGVLVKCHIDINEVDINEVDPLDKCFQLVGSCNGLICLTESVHCHYNPKFICNPLTGEYMTLPEYEKEPTYDIISGFGYDEVAKEYKVLRMMCHYYELCKYIWEAEIYTLGSGDWRKLGDVPYQFLPCIDNSEEYFPQVLVNGAFHWCTYEQDAHSCKLIPKLIVAFDVGKEEFRVMQFPPIEGSTRYELLELGGHLCLSDLFHDRDEIWVMKEYGVQSSWTKECVITREPPNSWPPNGWPVMLLKNGNIVLVSGESVVSYDPTRNNFKKLKVCNMPQMEEEEPCNLPWVTATSHVNSYISPMDIISPSTNGDDLGPED